MRARQYRASSELSKSGATESAVRSSRGESVSLIQAWFGWEPIQCTRGGHVPTTHRGTETASSRCPVVARVRPITGTGRAVPGMARAAQGVVPHRVEPGGGCGTGDAFVRGVAAALLSAVRRTR